MPFPLKILIADDNPSDRFLLQKLLEKQGYNVIAVADGQQALDCFITENPSIVLLDALMPSVDGFATATQIKSLAGDEFVPIIFITGLEHQSWLEKCLQSGGDDVLVKPFNPVILRAKIRGFARMQLQHQRLAKQQSQLDQAKSHFEYEKEIARKVLDKVLLQGNLTRPDIRYLLSPLAVFNGDVVFAAEYSTGELLVMMGDFTGHGLAAAIGAIPLAELFYGMVGRGFSFSDILQEANTRLEEVLTVNVFCCAAAFFYDPMQNMVTVWNGGLPDVLLYQTEAGVTRRFQSRHLPLGIKRPDGFDSSAETAQLKPGDKLILHTDGLLEACDRQGRLWGERGVTDALAVASDGPFDDILSAFRDFTQNKQQDDVSLLQFTAGSPTDSKAPPCLQGGLPDDSYRWQSHYHFSHQVLRLLEPAHLLHQQLLEIPGMKPHATTLRVVLAEIFHNALEHGLLQLDSSSRNTAKGFDHYYRQREKLRANLDTGFIQVELNLVQRPGQQLLVIKVSDSGSGFDHRLVSDDEWLQSSAGHGIYLLKKLCRDVRFYGDGNIVEVSLLLPLDTHDS